MAHPATPREPNYDWLFPLLTVTPGPQASCLTDVVQPVSPTVSGNVTSSHHELTAAVSEDNGSDGEQLILNRLMSVLGLSDPKNHSPLFSMIAVMQSLSTSEIMTQNFTVLIK